jgi:hypothetical protein
LSEEDSSLSNQYMGAGTGRSKVLPISYWNRFWATWQNKDRMVTLLSFYMNVAFDRVVPA